MLPLICRTLRHEFRLHADSEALREQLRFMEIAPDLPGRQLVPVDLAVRSVDGFCAVRLPSGTLVEGSASRLVSVLHRFILADVLRGEGGAPLVHGATVVIDGRRLLLVGHKGSGKSTLALHLLTRGHRVEGDEHLVIGEAAVTARPRTMRIKPGSLALVADVSAAVWSAPSLDNWDGVPIRAVSPALLGRPWTIETGRLDGLVFLVANHGGRSFARPVEAEHAFRQLMADSLLGATGISIAAGRLRRLATETPAYRLSLGDLEGATWHLGKIASLLTVSPAMAQSEAG